MYTYLILVLLIIILFLSLHFINQILTNKLINLTGVQSLLIGILINEAFINFINHKFQINLPILLSVEASTLLQPIIAVILGSIGFSVGLHFRIKNLLNFSIDHLKLSIVDISLSFLILSGIGFIIINNFYYGVVSFENLFVNSLIIGITASTLSSSVLELIKNKFQVEGNNFQTLLLMPKINNFLAVALVGLIFNTFYQGSKVKIAISPIEWFILSILIGLLLGFLFFIFLEKEEDEKKLLLAVLGIISIVSGLAYYLRLTPLFINLLVGFVIGNLLKSRNILLDLFKKLELVFYVILLIYAGTLIKIDNYFVFVSGFFLYLLLRYSLKYFNGWFAHQILIDKSKFNPLIGKGLNTQGILAIAIMINFHQFFFNPLSNTIFAIIIFAVIINEIISIRTIKNLLIDLNEIK